MHYPLIPWSFANIYKLKLLIMFLSAIFDRKGKHVISTRKTLRSLEGEGG